VICSELWFGCNGGLLQLDTFNLLKRMNFLPCEDEVGYQTQKSCVQHTYYGYYVIFWPMTLQSGMSVYMHHHSRDQYKSSLP
jgi:hypothetical protein